MQMIQDARRAGALSYALFAQKAQKRTVIVQVEPEDSTVSHFISLPEITYSVSFMKMPADFKFLSLFIAYMKDQTPRFLPLHNVYSSGYACFGEETEYRGNSIGEIAEKAVSTFWNSKFSHSYEPTRMTYYGGTPLANFKSWADYTKLHPDWIPEPNVPIEEEDVWFKTQPE